MNIIKIDKTEIEIPKIIWMYWHQGLDNAPFLVKKCIESWIEQNKDWEVYILNKENLHEYINIDLTDDKISKIVLANYSDLIRMKLLYTYGGIWADATTYCTKPLNSWIIEYSKSGFFSFIHEKPKGLPASWFLISQKDCFILKEVYRRKINYWNNNNLSNIGYIKRYVRKWTGKLLNKDINTIKYWFHPFVTKVLKIHPYFVMHYIMYDLIQNNKQANQIWKNTKKMDDVAPHKLKRIGFLNKLDENAKNIIDNEDIPMFKLTYKKYDTSKYTEDSILYYLFEGRFKPSP